MRVVTDGTMRSSMFGQPAGFLLSRSVEPDFRNLARCHAQRS